MTAIDRIEGRACVLRGNDIDTDRIIPARFLRAITFDGLGEHAFEDERFAGASILIVGANFGCGSSREHAPQALIRSGFRAFIGESFAEIFAGNCTALGLPYVTLDTDDLAALMDAVVLDPEQQVVVDLEARTVTSRAGTVAAKLPDGVRRQLLEGSWNATHVLLDAGDAIEATAARIPYFDAFPG
jgi:3-isopropylmalate/(R)-2-methylmalate dehydratase small subunit